MSGLVSRVLLRERLPDFRYGEVEALLREVASDVRDTRKGRHWDFDAASQPDATASHTFSLTIVTTTERWYDYEDDLLERELDYDDVPEAIEIHAACSDDFDYSICLRLSKEFTDLFSGIDLGITR